MTDFVDEASLGLQRVNRLSMQSRKSLSGDVLFLLSLFAHELENGTAILISRSDSDATRVVDELKSIVRDEPPSPRTHQRVLIVDSTPHGTTSDSPEMNPALQTIDLVVEFGREIHRPSHDQRPTRTDTWPKVEIYLDAIEGCSVFCHETFVDIPVLDLVTQNEDVARVFATLMRGLRTEEPEALINAARTTASREASKLAEGLQDQILRLSLENAGLRDNVIGAEATVGTLNWKLERLNAHLNHLQSELKIAREDRNAILRSKTFRLGLLITRPLRAARKLLRKIK